MSNGTVGLLCSGSGLGFYVPGLLINTHLRSHDISTQVFVFENYLSEDKKEKFAESKKAYHENFSLAVVAQKMPRDIRESFDYEAIEKLLDEFEHKGIQNFIVLSGHWIYILDMYKERIYPKKVCADILYIDSDLSPSWRWLRKYNADYSKKYKEIWLFDHANKTINYKINVSKEKPVPYSSRQDRYIVHGGGWGMGTYQSIIPELEEHGFKLDVILYNIAEAENRTQGNRYFMMDPSWHAWEKSSDGTYKFPPFGEVKNLKELKFTSNEYYHDSYDITRASKGIISKPGGGTLIDSLDSATPIIFLNPFGKHEQKNADLWIELGFGITFEKWKEANFSTCLLEDMHNNLMKSREGYLDYVECFLKDINFEHTKECIM